MGKMKDRPGTKSSTLLRWIAASREQASRDRKLCLLKNVDPRWGGRGLQAPACTSQFGKWWHPARWCKPCEGREPGSRFSDLFKPRSGALGCGGDRVFPGSALSRRHLLFISKLWPLLCLFGPNPTPSPFPSGGTAACVTIGF